MCSYLPLSIAGDRGEVKLVRPFVAVPEEVTQSGDLPFVQVSLWMNWPLAALRRSVVPNHR